MRLDGFRCDNCGVESREKRGRWVAVQSILVQFPALGQGWSAVQDGLHYCSRKCLLAAAEKFEENL